MAKNNNTSPADEALAKTLSDLAKVFGGDLTPAEPIDFEELERKQKEWEEEQQNQQAETDDRNPD